MKKKNQNKKVTKAQAKPAAIETTLTEKKVNVRREELKALSAQVKPLVDSGDFKSINAAIIKTVYTNDEHKYFKSFQQWADEGFTIRKGSKAFCIWGKRQTAKNENETFEYFPLQFIFSNSQVVPSKQEVQS